MTAKSRDTDVCSHCGHPQHGEPVWKFGIVHPSDRSLGTSSDGKEVWGAEKLIPFDTAEEAQAHVAKRSQQFPNSDWPQARVLRCKPGRPRIYPEWEYVSPITTSRGV